MIPSNNNKKNPLKYYMTKRATLKAVKKKKNVLKKNAVIITT